MFKKLGLSAIAAMQLVACGTSSGTVPNEATTESPSVVSVPDYLIQPGDELDIRFFRTPELNEVVIVRPDGRITLPLIPVIRVAGFSPEYLDTLLTEQYAEELIEPEISVIVSSFAGQKIYVGGEVNDPGVIEFTSPITIVEAAFMAGGFTTGAKTSEILIIRKGPDNRPYPIRVNTKELLAQGDVVIPTLMAADVVYVPRSAIANAGLFVDQYIRNLLMFDGFRASFGYDLDDRR